MKKTTKRTKKPTLKKKVSAPKADSKVKEVAPKKAATEYVPASYHPEPAKVKPNKEPTVLVEKDSLGYLKWILYLLCIFLALQIALWTYLIFSVNSSTQRSYRSTIRSLNSCTEKVRDNRKLKAEIARLEAILEQERSPKCPEPMDRHEILDPAEYAPYEKGGSAVIEGNFCVKLKDNTDKCFSRAQVFINPVTSYSDEWYHRGWAGREALKKADPKALKMNKSVITDQDGKFKFEGLAAGSYYVGAVACVPRTAKSEDCVLSRFATKVTMKNRVKASLKRVYP